MRRLRNWEDEMHSRWILKNCKIIAGLGMKNWCQGFGRQRKRDGEGSEYWQLDHDKVVKLSEFQRNEHFYFL